MKRKCALSIALGVGLLSPTLAFCAEGGASESGSWVALIFYIINFAIFVYILRRYAGPLAVKFFHDRAVEIRGTINLTEAGFRSASKTAQEAEAELKGLAAEKERLLKEMRAETAREAARIRELGQMASQRIRRDAEMTARSIADNGRRTIQAHLAATAARMARELIVNNFEPADQNRLVHEFLDAVAREARS
jgi:F0F1-type ATP synthase membrane subunit b/b'